jgi:acetyl-CoA C-acetyltransferase
MSKVYVIGGEQTDFERNWTKEGKSVLAMFKEVIEDALKATNLSYNDINRLKVKNKVGVFVGNFDGEQYLQQGHLGAFLTEVDDSFYGISSARYEAACASSSIAIDAAMSKN